MAKLVTAQPKFKMLVANIAGSGDPSRNSNPQTIARQGFVVQSFPEVARGAAPSKAASPQSPGLTTYRGRLTGSPAATGATITVSNSDFTAAASLTLGENTLISGQDYTASGAVQATASLTVNVSPSTATITIGGQTLVNAAGARTPGANNYNGTLGTPALIAADIIAAINDGGNGFTAKATAATGGGAVVNLTAVPVGALGNAVTLTTSNGNVSVSGATFTGGINATSSAATALAAAINALPDFTASAIGAVVTVVGPFGPNGNNLPFSAVYSGAVQNFTLSPTTGFLTPGAPTIGAPEIL